MNTSFTHDVFISYAHSNNWKPSKEEVGWVDAFVPLLRAYLARSLERRGHKIDPRIHWDEMNPRNSDFNKRLPEALTGSATLVALLSEEYLKSHWCGKEGDLFISELERRFPSGDSRREAIFLVDLGNVWEREAELKEKYRDSRFYELKRTTSGVYPFFTMELFKGRSQPRPLGEPYPSHERRDASVLFRALESLAEDLAEQLVKTQELRCRPDEPSHRVKIFLAPPTRTNGACRKHFKELRQRLISVQDLDVFPRVAEQEESLADVDDLRLSACLSGYDLFVQVLGGEDVDWDSRAIAFYESAKTAASADPQLVRLHLSSATLDELEPQLPEGRKEVVREVLKDANCTVYSTAEDLCKLVSDRIRRVQERSKSRLFATRREVLVEAVREDRLWAMKLRKELHQQGLRYTDRHAFERGGVLPNINDLKFDSVAYVWNEAQPADILELAHDNARKIEGARGRVPTAVFFYDPPVDKDLAEADRNVFEKGFEVVFDKEKNTERNLGDQVAQFCLWVAETTSGAGSS